MRRTFTTLSALLLSSIAVPALAQDASVTADLNMRAGPGSQYPVITTIPDGRSVDIYGCESGLNWCDVSWRGNRGWVYSDYLNYTYDRRTRPVAEWGARLDLPIVSFSFGDYADRHYRGMPWYADRSRWDDNDRRDRDGRRDRGDRRDRWDDDDRGDRDGRRGGWGDDDRRDRNARGGDRDDNDRRGRGGWNDRNERGDDERRGRGGDNDRGERGDNDRGRDGDRAERRDRGGARGNWMDSDPWDRGADRSPTNRDNDLDLWDRRNNDDG
ncbi:SH3 domain-containing protein [Aquibium sp. ELW1220]|uniref:SH3 domain-containing protein n=1 Tax=Aquibium sp. ELW1220 TaxID=2976766 RepID=UPI0025AFA323|nr:SH3 domain-containing protein [Aquibium sp. ELW1220]MDN2580906.1 SH3 domain-containing protein [Aquibium sp. ELW1220]